MLNISRLRAMRGKIGKAMREAAQASIGSGIGEVKIFSKKGELLMVVEHYRKQPRGFAWYTPEFDEIGDKVLQVLREGAE